MFVKGCAESGTRVLSASLPDTSECARSTLVTSALDAIWIDAAARLGVPVLRGGDAYVHYDGVQLHICTDEHLDADDTVAQLVLHELCHALVQGPRFGKTRDWGLDNTHNEDVWREIAAVRLQAHLAGAYALRSRLFPTTVVRRFFESLPADAFARNDHSDLVSSADGNDHSVPLARAAARRAAKEPWAGILDEALRASAAAVGVELHRASGLPLSPSGRACGKCAWRSEGGVCLVGGSKRVRPDERACARWETALDCLTCGACCRDAYDSVTVAPRDLVRHRHPALVMERGSYRELARAQVSDEAGEESRCAALAGPSGGDWRCTIYEDRPRTCREFTAGSRHCLTARRRVGLSW